MIFLRSNFSINLLLRLVKKLSLSNLLTASSIFAGSNTSQLSISALIKSAQYPLTPAKIGLLIAAYSNNLEGSTF